MFVLNVHIVHYFSFAQIKPNKFNLVSPLISLFYDVMRKGIDLIGWVIQPRLEGVLINS